MAKDVNIHLKTKGARQTKQDLDETGKAAKGVGDKTAEGQKQAAPAMDQGTRKLSAMGRVLNTLKTQVLSFLGAWLGLQAVQKLVTYLIQKLERIQELQKTIYEQSLQFAQVGQALEFQTGTLGAQQFWTEQAIALQKAGALRGPEVAEQMLVSMDIAFADRGGIKDRQIRELARQLAPFVGAAGGRGLGPQEVSKLFGFATAAGVPLNRQAYMQYFAEVQAGYTASMATDFGQYMVGVQTGVTPYIGAGGTLQEGISTFAATRSVTESEAIAATVLKQIARLSGGAYERPRLAMEEALGVKWSDITMDERVNALLEYVGRIPKSQRIQTLVEQGFPPELALPISTMVSPKALQTLEDARQTVAQATIKMVDDQTQAYLDSMLGKARQQEAVIAKRAVKAGPAFAGWERHLKDVRDQFGYTLIKGEDRWVKDSLEPYLIILEQMLEELKTKEGKRPTEGPARTLFLDILTQKAIMEEYALRWLYPADLAAKRGYQLWKRLKAIQQTEQPPSPGPSPPPIERPIDRRIDRPIERPIEQPIEPPVEPPVEEELAPAAFAPPPELVPERPQPIEQVTATPVAVNYDNRIINYRIVNPLVGVNKEDLLIESPRLC